MDGMSTLHVGGIGMLHPEILATQKLLTVREAEELTGRKAATWRKDIYLKKIPYVKLGRQIRIPAWAIQAMIRAGYHAPIEDHGPDQ